MPETTAINPDSSSPPRRASHSVAWNYAGYFFRILINLGLTSYIARRVAPAEYGLFLFVMALSAALYLLDLGISYFLVQSYVEVLKHGAAEKLSNLLWTVFLAFSALGALGMLVFIALALTLPGPFNIPHQQIHEAALIFILAGLMMQVSLPSIVLEQLYQAAHRFDHLNKVQMTGSLATFLFSVFVIHQGLGIVGLAAVQIIAVALQLLLLTAMLPSLMKQTGVRSLPRPHFQWSILAGLLQKSKWAFVYNLSLYGADLLTWLIITSLTSMKDAALFGIASKMPRQLSNIVDRGANVLLLLFSKSALEHDEKGLRRNLFAALKLLVGLLLPFVVLGCFFARPILQFWAGDAYVDATPVMQWLLIAAFAHGVGYPSDELLYVLGKAGKSAQISLWTGVLGSAMALCLVPRFGIAGIAAGTALVRVGTHCWWFTRESARLTHSSMRSLLRFVVSGLLPPLLILTISSAMLLRAAGHMALLWIVASAVAIGAVSLAVWVYRTALPFVKSRPELSA